MIELLILYEFVIRYFVKYESYIAEKDLSTYFLCSHDDVVVCICIAIAPA